ncbi:uncharacterized protein LOC132200924 [Neocloeon triangulifer]|uniref:uncharacterized protein LOC132200924 n=1 Tax=Neocloeon triangulifer TaxID=2078957 RepID=UPI00286F0655|nr:uncharacterized protein LOC132200924 [Neocloeon triangulifer]
MRAIFALVFIFAVVSALPKRKEGCAVVTSTTTTPRPTTTLKPEDVACDLETPLVRNSNAVDCSISGKNLTLTTMKSGVFHFNTSVWMTWCEAYNFCKANDMQLAHLYNRTMLRDVFDNYSRAFHSWIGSSDKGRAAGDFRWTSGELVDPALWLFGYLPDTVNCGALCAPSDLHPFNCMDRKGLICQVPPHCF